MKYITIATDISSDHRHKISTWACYIRHDGGAIKETGRFERYYKKSSHAETYALINALTIASKNVPDWWKSKIIIHNEIEHVLEPVRTKAGNITQRDMDRAKAIIDYAMPILRDAESWECRKIKAHYKDWQNSENPKKYAINRWCDTASRKLMREIRKGLKNSN